LELTFNPGIQDKVYVIGKTDAQAAAELEKAGRSLTADILK